MTSLSSFVLSSVKSGFAKDERLRAVFLVFRRGGRFGRRQLAAVARDDLDARPFAAGRDADRLRLVAAAGLLAGVALLVGALAPDLLAQHAGLGDLAGEQLQRTDGVVVPRDRVVDEVRVAVGVDDGDDRDLQL